MKLTLTKLIELIEAEGLAPQLVKRLSPEVDYDKFEPSFSITLDHETFKIRKIKNGVEWNIKRQIVEYVNRIRPNTLPNILYVGSDFAITEYVDGEPLQEDVNLDLLAQELYEFHIASSSALFTRQELFDVSSLVSQASTNLRIISGLKLFSKEKMRRIERILMLGVTSYTLGAIHGDLSRHNILQVSVGTYRLIDLESLRPFPLEYDFVKPMQDIFQQDTGVFERGYGNLLDNYKANETYWILFYLAQKIVERSQINRPKGIERAVELIEGVI